MFSTQVLLKSMLIQLVVASLEEVALNTCVVTQVFSVLLRQGPDY